MDRAQALAEPYLKIGKIVPDLSETLQSPEPSIASLLLERIELHKMDLHCLCYMIDDPSQKFRIPLPKHFIYGFLQSVADGSELSEVHYQVTFYLCANGSWETFSREDLTALGEQVIGRCVCNLPFSEFEVPRPEFENRLKASDVSIPLKWLGRDSFADDGLQEHVEWAFHKAHGIWHIGPLDNIRILKDSIGLQHIHFLLTRPDKPVEAAYLYADSIKLVPESVNSLTVELGIPGAEDAAFDYVSRFDEQKGPGTVLRGEGYGIMQDDTMDKRYRREVRKKITVLKEERDHLEEKGLRPELSPEDALEERQERLAELNEEIARYQSIVDAATRLDKNARPLLNTRTEKSRKSVWAAIIAAYRKINKLHPEIYVHLKKTITTGHTLIYSPQSPRPRWTLIPPTA